VAPAEKILRVQGAVLKNTALEVNESELDAYGFYVPRPAKDLADFLHEAAMGEIDATDEEMRRAEDELKALDSRPK
jgi:hypothetical protein